MLAPRRAAIPLLLAALLVPSPFAQGAAKPRPKAFASCGALGKYARAQALKIAGPEGIPLRFGFAAAVPRGPGPQPVADSAPVPAPQQESSGGIPQPNDFSGTNNQEEGVDEPDSVKTDGNRLYVASAGSVHILDVRGDAPELVGSLELKGYGHELLLAGDRLLALTTYYGDPVLAPQQDSSRGSSSSMPSYYYSEPATRLFEIDVSDPSEPKLLNTLTVEGFYTSARLVGSAARVVISTPPDPAGTESKRAIRRSRISTWIPDGVLRDRVRRERSRQRMVACHDVRRAGRYAGPGTLTVLTLDLEQGLDPVDSDSLMTDAQTVYASKRSLFVAAERWFDPAEDAEIGGGRHTAIHRFDIADARTTEYRASGRVRGFALNQFSLSEHDGALRVATTEQPPWRDGSEQRESESFVTVLGEGLREVGRVGGLGRGERIYAVRFVEDIGYVVTFRQTDPLYTLDLSNPREPTVEGELKILGFSSYLHPIGDGLLLGVGQDANEQGRTRGTQLSLFDVSDLSAPARLHQWSLGQYSSSGAEYDHHAFLYWPPTQLAVIPLSYYAEDDSFDGAIGFDVDRDNGISELGRAEHDYRGYATPIRRSLVVGERLLTVSDAGVLASTLDTLAPGGFAPFPQPDYDGDVVVGHVPPPN